MNLSYEVTHDELKGLFGKFGEIENIEIPFRKGGKGTTLGISYVKFAETEGAITAFATLDKTYFQGRKLHILPAKTKPPSEPRIERTFEEREAARQAKGIIKPQSDYVKEKEQTLKLNFDEETNWNYLFMNQDTVASSMAKKLGIQKSDLLDKDSSNMAVKMAQSETIIVNQTKEWLQQNGIDLYKLEKTSRKDCKRSDTTLLVKNIPYSTKEKDLNDIFERYGSIQRLLISPFNTLAIIEYKTSSQATAAAKNLAYYKVNYIMPIYLEFAPADFISDEKQEESESDDNEGKEAREKTVFIKNLNFTTTETQIEELFKISNLKGKILSVKIVRRSDNQ